MKIEFTFQSKQDVEAAKAVLSALEIVLPNEAVADAWYPGSTVHISPYAAGLPTQQSAEPIVAPKWRREDIKRVAETNPRLAELASKKGRKRAEEIAEIDRIMTAALGAPHEPIGEALEGDSAEELNAALKDWNEVEADTLTEILGDASVGAEDDSEGSEQDIAA